MWFLRCDWVDADALLLGRTGSTRVYRSEAGDEGCAYFDEEPDVRAASLQRPAAALLVRLSLLLDVRGAAAGSDAAWHYIVATDVLAEQEEDFNAWYEREHLPGLAAVPGTAHAARYRVVGGAGPRYHACYDLAERSAFNSEGWLAVRATPWSLRVRSAFFNTRRSMYRRVDAQSPRGAHSGGTP